MSSAVCKNEKRRDKKERHPKKVEVGFHKSESGYGKLIKLENLMPNSVPPIVDLGFQSFTLFNRISTLLISALIGLTRLNLDIQLYCLSHKELQDSIPKAIEKKSIADIEEWKHVHPAENQLIKTVKFLKSVHGFFKILRYLP
ncbi:MAG: hypothetical protein ACJAWV_002329 [Flammeovirgaceae bacterium]